MRKKIEYKPQPTCEHCGGLHYGTGECPYLASDPGGHIAAHQKEIRKNPTPPAKGE